MAGDYIAKNRISMLRDALQRLLHLAVTSSVRLTSNGIDLLSRAISQSTHFCEDFVMDQTKGSVYPSQSRPYHAVQICIFPEKDATANTTSLEEVASLMHQQQKAASN